jgi:hypothetical protein
VVESQPSKLLVAGSIPVSRSNLRSHETSVSFGWQATRVTTREGCPPKLAQLAPGERRWTEPTLRADVAQLAERVLGKDEVTSSILVIGSNLRPLRLARERERDADGNF